jgi:hypothetical protein
MVRIIQRVSLASTDDSDEFENIAVQFSSSCHFNTRMFDNGKMAKKPVIL